MKITNLVKCPATGKADNQFVGIKISNNQIEFHYPETFQLSDNDDDLRQDILAVLRTVSLAKTQTSDMSSYYSVQHERDAFPLGAFLWIINDYLTYGRYENREKVYVRGSNGRINWKRTMHSNPIISRGNIIYSDIVSETRSHKDNILTEIYYFCVQKSVDSIGWLYGIVFDPEGVDYYKLFINKKRYYLSVLNTEITHTFDDQKKMRLQNMKNIITGLDDDLVNTREIVYGVDSYDYVYEKMVDSMFSRVKNIKDFYPNAYWELVLEEKPVKSSNLRPDTVLIKNNKVYILDAKYYRYGTTFKPGDMPDTTSIQKQITYGEYVRKVKEGLYSDVFSAFVMPYSKNENKNTSRFNRDIEFVGIGHAAWLEDENEHNRKIAAILVDTRFLTMNYLRQNDSVIEQLIDIIEKRIAGSSSEAVLKISSP